MSAGWLVSKSIVVIHADHWKDLGIFVQIFIFPHGWKFLSVSELSED